MDMGLPIDGLLPNDGASRLRDDGVGRASMRLSSGHLGLKVLHRLLAHRLSCFALGPQRTYRQARVLFMGTVLTGHGGVSVTEPPPYLI